MWGDVTAARMRAQGPGPAQGLGDGIQLEPNWSPGMLQLPTATSLPMGRILTVLRVQSPLLVGLNLIPVPLDTWHFLGWGGFSPTGGPVWAPPPCGFGASPLKARLLKGD